MLKVFKLLIFERSAQDLAEYGIALAIIGGLTAGAAVIMAQDVNTLWSNAQKVIESSM